MRFGYWPNIPMTSPLYRMMHRLRVFKTADNADPTTLNQPSQPNRELWKSAMEDALQDEQPGLVSNEQNTYVRPSNTRALSQSLATDIQAWQKQIGSDYQQQDPITQWLSTMLVLLNHTSAFTNENASTRLFLRMYTFYLSLQLYTLARPDAVVSPGPEENKQSSIQRIQKEMMEILYLGDSRMSNAKCWKVDRTSLRRKYSVIALVFLAFATAIPAVVLIAISLKIYSLFMALFVVMGAAGIHGRSGGMTVVSILGCLACVITAIMMAPLVSQILIGILFAAAIVLPVSAVVVNSNVDPDTAARANVVRTDIIRGTLLSAANPARAELCAEQSLENIRTPYLGVVPDHDNRSLHFFSRKSLVGILPELPEQPEARADVTTHASC